MQSYCVNGRETCATRMYRHYLIYGSPSGCTYEESCPMTPCNASIANGSSYRDLSFIQVGIIALAAVKRPFPAVIELPAGNRLPLDCVLDVHWDAQWNALLIISHH
jgi:hypothetical protein